MPAADDAAVVVRYFRRRSPHDAVLISRINSEFWPAVCSILGLAFTDGRLATLRSYLRAKGIFDSGILAFCAQFCICWSTSEGFSGFRFKLVACRVSDFGVAYRYMLAPSEHN